MTRSSPRTTTHRHVRPPGKTTFLKFMLARLISTRQVVVLCDNRRSYLFYAGTVYSRSAEFGFMNLPERQATRYFPVWALIDVDFENRGPNLASTNVWPIQASCPNPVLWHAWRKQHRAALLGMPLWSMEELMAGYVFTCSLFLPCRSSLTVIYLCSFDLHTFRRFLRGLKKSLPLLDRPTLPTALDRDTDAILKVLQAEREKVEEDCDKMGGVMTSVPDQDATMVDETNKPQTPADQVRNALKILVRNATEEFGFAPRDVYNGVLLLFETRDDHRRVMTNLTCSDLVSLVRSFSGDCQLDTRSENVVAVHPHQITDRLDGWEVRFKSTQITRGVERMVQEVEVKNLRETYCLLHKIPEASVLAGWFFETLTRRMFSEGWEGPAPPQLTYMVSNNCDPPTFFTNPSCPSLPYKPRIRTVTEVKFAPNHGIPDVTLDEGKFYISTATDNPLFDSFTVRRYPGIIIISVFRISIAKSHGRSAEGYSRIHKIIRRVRELLEEATLQPEVRVVYSLVCPEDNLQHEWKMPPGWTENAEEWDHPGVVSCIRVPVSGHLNA